MLSKKTSTTIISLLIFLSLKGQMAMKEFSTVKLLTNHVLQAAENNDVILLWSVNCPPCRKKLLALDSLVLAPRRVFILSVSTQKGMKNRESFFNKKFNLLDSIFYLTDFTFLSKKRDNMVVKSVEIQTAFFPGSVPKDLYPMYLVQGDSIRAIITDEDALHFVSTLSGIKEEQEKVLLELFSSNDIDISSLISKTYSEAILKMEQKK